MRPEDPESVDDAIRKRRNSPSHRIKRFVRRMFRYGTMPFFVTWVAIPVALLIVLILLPFAVAHLRKSAEEKRNQTEQRSKRTGRYPKFWK